MTDLKVSLAHTFVITEGGDMKLSQAFSMAVINYPAEALDVSQVVTLLPYSTSGADVVTVAQLFTMVVVKGLPVYPICRAWTYTLDGHDYYILNTINETLVCDLSQDPPSWSVWGSGDEDKWRAWVGRQWIAKLPYEETFGSNVVVGDIALATLGFLNPASPVDDNPDFEAEEQVPFRRVITGQIVTRGFDYVDCPGVIVTGSTADLPSETYVSVELLSSDDGHNYNSHGTVDLVSQAYETRLQWLSLGSMTSPGRLFQLVDYGALTRIDDWEMPDGGSQDAPES